MTWEKRHHSYRFAVGWWLYLAAMLLMWMQFRYGHLHRMYGQRFDWMWQQTVKEELQRLQAQYPPPPPEFPTTRRRWWYPK